MPLKSIFENFLDFLETGLYIIMDIEKAMSLIKTLKQKSKQQLKNMRTCSKELERCKSMNVSDEAEKKALSKDEQEKAENELNNGEV